MLDIGLVTRIALVGALVGAAVMRLAILGAPRPWRRAASWSWSVGAGVLAASGAAGQWPMWPALEDRARFLALLVPLTMAAETLGAMIRSGKLVWSIRLSLAAAVAPILLYRTVYLADLNGPNSAEWSLSAATIILCALAVLLSLTWASIARLESRTSTAEVHWLLSLDALVAACVVMLSGYYRGGLLGIGLAGAIAGTTLASSVGPPERVAPGNFGMGLIGIFTVVLIGRFFGSLPTSLAACLLLAPLVAWAMELPHLQTAVPRGRSIARFVCVAIPLIAALAVAKQRFTEASMTPRSSSQSEHRR